MYAVCLAARVSDGGKPLTALCHPPCRAHGMHQYLTLLFLTPKVVYVWNGMADAPITPSKSGHPSPCFRAAA